MRGSMRRFWRALQMAMGLTLCGAALCGAVYVQGTGLDGVLELLRPRQAHAAARMHAPAAPAPMAPALAAAEPAPAVALAVTGAAPEAGAEVPTTALPRGVEAPEGVLVPRFVGMRLSEALSEAERLGLKLRAVDQWGDPVRGSEARYYRVRRQLTEPGALVDGGSRVKLRVRSFGAAMGY